MKTLCYVLASPLILFVMVGVAFTVGIAFYLLLGYEIIRGSE